MKWLAWACLVTGVFLLGFGLEIARIANWYLHFTGVIPDWLGWGLVLFGLFCFYQSRPRVFSV